MADQQQYVPASIFELISRAGVKRDGTDLDSAFWQDAQHARFQRGRLRKMGGYTALNAKMLGPGRSMLVDSRAGGHSAHVMSQWGIEKLSFDNDGVASNLYDRTPAGFTPNADYAWQCASMFQSGGGAAPLLLCSATPDLTDLASDVDGPLYQGDITDTAALTAIADGTGDILVSGGLCVLQPFTFLYGSSGLIRNSNANDVSTASGWTTGGANQASIANVASTKIVKGLPVRGGGNSPAGLFWALDALIRVSFINDTNVLWRYDTISDDVTILAKNGVVEYDNAYFWIGADRFFVYNGIVQELPNQMSLNWFFENLNYSNRQKVWAIKVPRFGEIWWFFPSGVSTECDAAIIYNVREQTWYDTRLPRTCGSAARVFPQPVMTGELTTTTMFKYTPTGGSYSPAEAILGLTSGATGTIVRATATQINIDVSTGTFANGESIVDTSHGGIDTGTITSVPISQSLTNIWRHEYGVDRIEGATVTAIQSYATTNNFQWMDGGPAANAQNGPNYQMRLLRLEPDFVMTGDMALTVTGKSYAQGSTTTSDTHTFSPSTEFIDLREQHRELAITFESNIAGGDYQAGKIFIMAEQGDERG